MGRRKLAENLTLAAVVVTVGCASDHRVSPWGALARPTFSPYVRSPDLPARLGEIDVEAARAGLVLEVELSGELPRGGGALRVRGYRGRDALDRPIHAVRVASARGIVMALGPLDARDVARDAATELVAALVPGPGGGLQGSAFRSGTDLNGDGSPDVVVRNDAGALEVWALGPLGASRYEVELVGPPVAVVDLQGDGQLALASQAPLDSADPIRPVLDDVATFDRARYSDHTAAALAFHQRAAAALAAASAPPSPEPAATARRALERAWHRLLAGHPSAAVLSELERTSAPLALRGAFAAHRRTIGALAGRQPVR